MAIHYWMLGMERNQVWWGLCGGQLGITLERGLHYGHMSLKDSSWCPPLVFFPIAIFSGVCWNQPRFSIRGQCIGGLWFRYFMALTVQLDMSCVFLLGRDHCTQCLIWSPIWFLFPGPGTELQNPQSYPRVGSPLQHTLLVTPGSLLMRAFGELSVSFQWRVILRGPTHA